MTTNSVPRAPGAGSRPVRRPSGSVALGAAAVVLSLIAAACSGGTPAAQDGSQPGSPSRDGVPPPGSTASAPPLTDEQLRQTAKDQSRPIRTSKRNPLPLGKAPTIPEKAPPGGIIVSAFIKKNKRATPRVVSRTLPEGSTRAEVEAVIRELSTIPGVQSVDWSPPLEPQSAVPNDPRWLGVTVQGGAPNYDQPNLAVPMARIGLCCAPGGITDGWAISSSVASHSSKAPEKNVNIAIIDGGLVVDGPGDVAADLESRFIGGWDDSNTTDYYGSLYPVGDLVAAGKGWATFEKGDLAKNAHGTNVAGYAMATADNSKGSAGVAGNLKNVKFGSFRVFPYAAGGAVNPIKSQAATALSFILAQVDAYQANPKLPGAQNWNVVNMSLGGPKATVATSKTIDELADRGVLVTGSAGNARANDNGGGPTYGINPGNFPAMYPNNTSVAGWGSGANKQDGGWSAGYPNEAAAVTASVARALSGYVIQSPSFNGTQWKFYSFKADYGPMYGDVTGDYSSFGNATVDITAPGTLLPAVAHGGYANNADTGTSYAAPTLAGVAASMISINGDNYRCTDKSDKAARLSCLAELRAVLIGSTTDITGSAENPETQGSGLIDVPRAFSGTPSIIVPPAPINLRGNVAITPTLPPAVGEYDYKATLTWTAVDIAKLGIPDAQLPDVRVQYQIYVEGDPSRGFSAAAGDAPVAGNAAPVRNGNLLDGWNVPAAWTDRRLPIPPTDLSTFTVTNINQTNPTLRFQVKTTLIYSQDDGTGKKVDRRITMSLPSTIDCTMKVGVVLAASPVGC